MWERGRGGRIARAAGLLTVLAAEILVAFASAAPATAAPPADLPPVIGRPVDEVVPQLTVRGGALVDVRPSQCVLTVTLASEGVRLASHTTRVALPGLLSLGAGYPLVDGQRSAGTPAV